MLKRDYQGQVCSIARALEVVGDRWTLLIVRDVAFGLRRFDELLDSLGVASNVLADRLNRLVAEGVLDRTLGNPQSSEIGKTQPAVAVETHLLLIAERCDCRRVGAEILIGVRIRDAIRI